MQAAQNTPLTNTELETLLGFIGYGRLDAPVWFLGMEEAGGGEDNLRKRLQFEPVMDLKAAHRILGLVKFHEGPRPVIQRTWWGMCQVMLRLLGKPSDRESVRNYQVKHLGSTTGDTMLVSLLPFPRHKDDEWGYERLVPRYPNRAAYLKKVTPRRMAMLTGLVSEHKPRVVLAFGKAYWEYYEKLFAGTQFQNAGHFRCGRHKNTFIVLTDQFTARTMNNRWDELAALINARAPDIKHLLENKELYERQSSGQGSGGDGFLGRDGRGHRPAAGAGRRGGGHLRPARRALPAGGR